MFEYHMVQVPPGVSVKAGQSKDAAAHYLQDVVNHYAHQGWEFYGVESFRIHEGHGCGCLGTLFGMRGTSMDTYVIVFRR